MDKIEQIYNEVAQKMNGELAFVPPFERFEADMEDYCVNKQSEEYEIRDAAEDFLSQYRTMNLKREMLYEMNTSHYPTGADVCRLEREGVEFVFNADKKEYVETYDFPQVFIDELTEDYNGDKEKALAEAKKDLADRIYETRYGIIIRWEG